MDQLLLIAGLVVLLVILYALYQRQRERDEANRINRAGDDPAAIMGELDEMIKEDKASEEFWRRQGGRKL